MFLYYPCWYWREQRFQDLGWLEEAGCSHLLEQSFAPNHTGLLLWWEMVTVWLFWYQNGLEVFPNNHPPSLLNSSFSITCCSFLFASPQWFLFSFFLFLLSFGIFLVIFSPIVQLLHPQVAPFLYRISFLTSVSWLSLSIGLPYFFPLVQMRQVVS